MAAERASDHAVASRPSNRECNGDQPASLSRNLMTASELADRWQVQRSQIYALTRAGKVPVVRIGRYFRYRPEAIELFEEGGGPDV